MKDSESNEISLKNALDTGLELLRNSPLYSSKEILIILSANSTCDPGEISETIEELSRMKIKVSIVTLSCKIYIGKRITEETGGHYDLAINKEKFRDILMRYTTPSKLEMENVQSTLVPIGFPTRITNEVELDSKGKKDLREVKFLCCCHEDKPSSAQHYICPRCKSRNCEVPSKCGICGLNLISAPLLARTFHYLDPVGKFTCYKVNIKENQMEEEGSISLRELSHKQKKCKGCDLPWSAVLKAVNHVSKCGRCNGFFCLKCDIYIHDSLFNCPECL
jgi:transcription initiation factor TFIIH subunit 2